MATWTELSLKSFAASFIEQSRSQLATIATAGFQSSGRGTIAVSVRGEMPTSPPGDLRRIQIGYRTLERFRFLTEALRGASREGVNRTIDLIRTYDPTRHAVVVIIAGPMFLTFSTQIAIDPIGVIVGDADVIH